MQLITSRGEVKPLPLPSALRKVVGVPLAVTSRNSVLQFTIAAARNQNENFAPS